MRIAPAVAGLAARSSASSLADICTTSNIKAALPSNGTLLGIELVPSSVTASAVYDATLSTTSVKRTTYSYCNASVTYTHAGLDDTVVLEFALPEPSDFENRWYVAGGEAYSLSAVTTGGLEYGAAGGATSAGYDAFENSYDDVMLLANGTLNLQATHMFGYRALGEMTLVAKSILPGIYGLSNSTSTNSSKIFTYFEVKQKRRPLATCYRSKKLIAATGMLRWGATRVLSGPAVRY